MKDIVYPHTEGTVFPKWTCVLRTCDSCPLYNVWKYESNASVEAPQIWSCSVHSLLGESTLFCDLCSDSDLIMGKIRTRKMLTMKEVSIGNFIFDFYFPALQTFEYHIHNVDILFKDFCWVKRRNVFIYKHGNLLLFVAILKDCLLISI